MKQIKRAKAQFFRGVSKAAIVPQKLWHIFKLASTTYVPKLYCEDRSVLATTVTEFEKAETLNNYFSECFTNINSAKYIRYENIEASSLVRASKANI